MGGLEDLTDRRLLEKTLFIQEKIIDGMMTDGLPATEEDRTFLLAALNGAQKTLLGKAKIKVAETSADVQRKQLDTVAMILRRTAVSKEAVRTTSPDLPHEYLPKDILPGEMEIGQVALDMDEIMRVRAE